VVEPAGGERKEAWRNLLKGLVERGLRGVRLVISDDHPSIRQAVMAELPGASWRRWVARFTRNVLAHVPRSERGVVAEELQEVFVARRRGTAESLARGFVERYRDRFKRAVEVFAQGLAAFPSGKHGEDWAFRRYLDIGPLWAAEEKPTKIATRPFRRTGFRSGWSPRGKRGRPCASPARLPPSEGKTLSQTKVLEPKPVLGESS
jgi:putative transposase